MCDAQQEMTLEQWVDRLPGFHLANREYKELLARVEELNETISFLDPPYGILELQDLIDAAEARVEEMNEAEKHWAFKHGVCKGMHHSTDEMIDDVVQWLENIYSDYSPTSLSISTVKTIKDYLWNLLNKLNIYRCEGCGGSCWSKEEHQSPCPTCHGHGWTIGDQK